MNRLSFWVAVDLLLFLLFALALYAVLAIQPTGLLGQETSATPPVLAALAQATTTSPNTITAQPSPTVPASAAALTPNAEPGTPVAAHTIPGTASPAVREPDNVSPGSPATRSPVQVKNTLPVNSPTNAPKPTNTPAATPTRRPVVLANPTPAASAPRRYLPPPAWILGPMQGSGEDEKFITDLLWYIDENHIPITAFHFDSDRWETCANNAQFRFSDGLLQRMRSHNPPIRALFWIVPLITKGCGEYGYAASQGYFVRNADGSPIVTSGWEGSGSWIDFGNPQAVAYWHSLLDRIFTRASGVIGGFYTDDVRPDLTNNSSYSDAFVRDLLDYTRSKVPDGDVVMKAYGQNTPDQAFLSHYGHAGYVNDMDSSFSGLREGIRRVLTASAWLPAAFNEFTGYAMRVPDTETYVRRMQWGAFQPIMENDSLPKNAVPWDPQYPPQVLSSYQYYATLHWELVPFFHTYDELAYRDNRPVFQQPNPGAFSTILGKEFFVQYVTDYMQNIAVTLPAGKWINYWNEQQVFTGPATISYPVPLGREPIFVANGAIIPMQVRDGTTGHGTTASLGALTVNVFPNGHSTFSYFDTNQKWLLFDVRQTGNQVSLCTSARPSQPLIYRIARWSSPPTRVSALQGAVGVNMSWGTALPALGSEMAIDGSSGGWYYESARQHLIVKLSQVGAFCP